LPRFFRPPIEPCQKMGKFQEHEVLHISAGMWYNRAVLTDSTFSAGRVPDCGIAETQ